MLYLIFALLPGPSRVVKGAASVYLEFPNQALVKALARTLRLLNVPCAPTRGGKAIVLPLGVYPC